MTKFFLLKTNDYDKWVQKQSACDKVQIALRLSRIEVEGYFGIHRYLDDNVWELKWGNG